MEFEDDLIELRAVTEKTKGPAVGHDDQNGDVILQLGLSDELVSGVRARPRARTLLQIQTMALRLADHLHWCDCCGRAVFLDARNDWYFCLATAANEAFLRLARGTSASG